MTNSVEVKNVVLIRRKRRLVNNVSLKVNPREIVGLLGPNGAGKTTIFETIIGLHRPNEGQIIINNTDISALPESSRARMGLGYLPQENSIHRGLTVAENILAPLQIRQDLNAHEKQTALEDLLHEFNLAHLRHNKGATLSGGERRRTEIARSLASNPSCILLDEPFAGVDPLSVEEIKKMITHLKQRGLGILITDHNVRETLDICERAYILNNGEIIAEGSPKAILSNQKVRDVYLGQDFALHKQEEESVS
ncbi:MAG: LPS export ABC transporter ATP-binding protein [Gammaproteobacteria bacterium]|nr:LPS export ABC transporter ATP-binding protein [Gammaproteobacteria bacterium]